MHLRQITITASDSPALDFSRILACQSIRELELVNFIAPERSHVDFE
jgi:hypothetical protein